MATPVATVAPQSRFNDDGVLFISESIGVLVVELELFNVRVVLMVTVELFDDIHGGICLHINIRLTLPRNAGMQNSCFHFRC
ncbi:hypothetical protein Hanom_Chr04g00313331 [Helianthus anomalus]